MKRRKILVLIPALGLLLSGCTFEEGFATAKHWVGQNIYHPVKDWIESITGKKKEEQKPSGEEGGGGEETEDKFTVTFNVQGHGTAPASVEVEEGGKVTKPTDPSADGWTFGGWFKEAACTNAWDFANDTVTANVTLYAKWTENGGGETTDYGTEDSPLSVSDALAVIEKECTTDGSLTKQRIYCVGLISAVDNTFNYDSGPCFELHVADKAVSTKVVHVYRVHCTEEQKANVVVGAEIKFSGFAKNFKDELEFVDNGQEACSILTVTAPSGEDAVTGVTFNATSYEVAVGATAKVAATVQPLTAGNKNVTYSLKEVSPAGCVTISGDTLTGVAVGSAKVVVTTEEGGFTAEVPVSVVAATNYGTLDNPISVTAAKAIIDKECGTDKKANTDSVIYCEAEIKTLGEYNSKGYYQAVTVKDESNEIYVHTLNADAEIKDSVVVGATIVFHGYGKYYNNAPQFGTANNVYVTVDSVVTETPTVSAVTLDQSALAIEVGAADVQLHATVEGEHKPSQAVTWHSSDEEVAAVDENGFVHAVAEGEANITATSVLDPKVVSEPCVVTVTEPETPIVLESISVTGPTKTSYDDGDHLDLTGLVVTAHYEGGSSEVVEKWTSDPADGAELSTENTKVTISYQGKTADVAITVAAKDPLQKAYEVAEGLPDKTSSTSSYTFTGVVVAKRGTDDYYVQKGSYALDLYKPGTVDGLAVGKEISVTAPVKKYNGTLETGDNPEVTVIGDGTPPASTTIDSADALAAAKQNVRCNISGAIASTSTSSKGDVTIHLTVGTSDITLFVKSAVKEEAGIASLATATVGQLVELTDAVTGCYNTTLQVLACENSTAVVTDPAPKTIVGLIENSAVGIPQSVEQHGSLDKTTITVGVNYDDSTTGNVNPDDITLDTENIADNVAGKLIVGEFEYDFTINVVAESSEKTAKHTSTEIATLYSWTTSVQDAVVCYKEFDLDSNITISTTGADDCGSFWGSDWRLYQAKSGDVVITAKEGYELVSVKLTYGNKNNGVLKDGTTTVSSATVVELSGSSKTFTVGNSGTATNGQVRITAFEVVYRQA